MGGGVGLGGWGDQGGCEWRSEAFVKIQKKKNFFWGGGIGSGGGGVGSGGGGVGLGGQGGWERRIEAIVKIQLFFLLFFFWGRGGGRVGGGWSGGVGLGVRVDVNGEVKVKFL